MVFADGPLDALDHAADHFAYGSKMGIDATRKDPTLDRFPREWPSDLQMAEEIVERVTRQWKKYGIT
jgi:4-hydroxy-3-polyprenylbenzoate decarboxylase